MARVTSSEVKEILNTTLTLDAFITAANLIVTDHLGTSGLSAERLKEIERWLTAHFAVVRDVDENVMSKSTGDASVSIMGKSGLGLDGSRYGQQVKLLDSTGRLSDLGKTRVKVEIIESVDMSD